MKRRKTVSALILLLAALLMLTGLSSCKDPEPEPLTDEEALRGQWAVYVVSPDTGAKTGTGTGAIVPGTQEKEEFAGFIIDIQYTKPGYWFFGLEMSGETDPENIEVFYDVGDNPETASGADGKNVGFYISSNRTQEEDGWFVVSASYRGDGTKIRYRFTDEERNTMEAEVYDEKPEPDSEAENSETEENTDTDNYIMRRLNHVIEILPLSEAENPEDGEGATTTT